MSMALSLMSCTHDTGAVSVAWPDVGSLRWPYVAFDRDTIATDAVPAVCVTKTGALWEYDGERFLLTDVVADVRRRPTADPAAVPPGPWRHLPACACEVCRLGNV